MQRVQQKMVTVAVGVTVFLAGLLPAQAQMMHPPHVYNPSIYQNNRMLMNHRAAARAIIKKHHRMKTKAKAKRRVPAQRKPK